MSTELKNALRTIKEYAEADGSPFIYLHDPDTLRPFGALFVDPRLMDKVEKSLTDVETWSHSHCEGDEDEN